MGDGGGDASPLLVGTGKDDVHLLVVMTAERGLCGGFNSTIVRLARQRIERLKSEGKTVKILTVGKKGRDALVVEWEESAAERRGSGELFAEYRELLLSFSDSLFDIINALSTLAAKPPRPFASPTGAGSAGVLSMKWHPSIPLPLGEVR
mgnify:CR=1 FL=1